MKVASGTITNMKKYLVGSFIISALLVPVLASAATAEEIQAQIQSLLTQITALQQQLSGLTSNTSTTISITSNSCPNLYRALLRGSRGSDVISLQQFLIAQGLLSSDSATGFFGSMTESAVQRWQAQNSIVAYGDANTTGYGVIGARTRAAIAARCGTTTPPVVQSCPQYQIPICSAGQHVENGATNSNGCVGAPRCVNNSVSCPIYNACPTSYTTNTSIDTNGCTKISCTPWQPTGSLDASPTSGTAPLKVTFTAATNAGFFGGVRIDFGDGSTAIVLRPGGSEKNGILSHEYAKAGTYVVQLIGVGEGSSTVLGTQTVTVSASSVASTFTASPSAGTVPLTVRFTGISSGVSIDLGDGVKSSWIDGTPPYVDYTYKTAGTYTASLRGLGGVTLSSITIVVSGGTGSAVTIKQDSKDQMLQVESGCHTFALQPCGYISVSGTATNVSALYVALVKGSYSGATDYNNIYQATKTMDSPAAQLNSVSTNGGSWTTSFRDAAGTYRVIVYDTGTQKLLLYKTIIVRK